MTKPNSKLKTFSWMLWDWAEQPYPTIMQTFIFPVYLANAVATTAQQPDQSIAWALGIAGLIVAVIAPALGRRSDNNGRRKFWLVINTFVLVGITAGSFFVEPKPEFFILGLVLYGLGSVVQESAFVNYYAMLKGVTNERNMGRISGFAWALGYVGGIILLLVCLIAFDPANPTEGSLNIRMIFIFAAIWILVFSIPLMLFVPEISKKEKLEKESILQSWVNVFRDLSKLRKQAPETLKFLIASAIYRDGLAGVFSLGAVLGTYAFGFTTASIIMYGVAANIVAALGAIVGGWLDDRIGSRNIIAICLGGMVLAGSALFIFSGMGPNAYWIFGLTLSLFVGPAQASSRTFVSRFTPEGREGEVFGLYQLTGRAVSFLSPSLWGLFIGIAVAVQQTTDPMKTTIYGIWGIVLILVVGLFLLLRVHPNPKVID
ncbi:MAG: MFS transporter [Acidobacteria bacterium]|nr:MFS transporter [Acidobacteriota bacterium]